MALKNVVDRDFSESQWDTVFALADAFLGPVSIESLVSAVPSYTLRDLSYESALKKFATDKPSNYKDSFKEDICKTLLPSLSPDSFAAVQQALNMLNNRVTCLLLTGYSQAFKNLSTAQREAIIKGWSTSWIPSYRLLFRTFLAISTLPYIHVSDLCAQIMRSPFRNPYLNDPQRFMQKEFYRYSMITQQELAQSSFDVVIIGSGSGAAVSAARLAQAGFSVLVLERGRYFHQDELTMKDAEALNNMFEHGGLFQSEGNNIAMLAGSTFGGGSTVNWSASLKPSAQVRREWAFKHGAEFYLTKDYERALTNVCEFMGVSDEHIVHSRANQILINGSEKLGSSCLVVPQNTGGYEHRCGYCGNGCRYGEKQGAVACWFVEAAKHGAKFLDQAEVLTVKHNFGKATGVEVSAYNGRTLFVPATVVVCAAGTMNTPGVLIKSGFRNKNIGQHLHIHPTCFVYGVWKDTDMNLYNEAILTAVSYIITVILVLIMCAQF